LPRSAAVSIDTVLALLGDGRGGGGGGGGSGGGRGGGGGRGASDAEAPGEGFWASVKRLGRGDVSPILGRLERQIARAEDHAARELGEKGAALARDVGVVAGVALTMLGIKALKILPSIPFAPGHKGVILIPLYVVAARLTRSPLGATLTGLTMGTVAFLMGDGRYGIFEIIKHLAPGVLCDVGLPLFAGGSRMPGPFLWSLFGAVIAAGRFATIFAMTLIVQAPKVAFAILIPGLTVHVTFGLLSGYVTYHLVRGVDGIRDRLGRPAATPPQARESDPERVGTQP
jgi:hypothetical protein